MKTLYLLMVLKASKLFLFGFNSLKLQNIKDLPFYLDHLQASDDKLTYFLFRNKDKTRFITKIIPPINATHYFFQNARLKTIKYTNNLYLNK